MNFTIADLKRMREAHDARIAANKANMTSTEREILLLDNLAKGAKIWFPKKDKPEEVTMRIMDFMTTKAFNTAGDEVGTFSAFRRYRTHKLPDGRVVICPSSFGKKCPICDFVAKHYDEIKADGNKSPYNKLKPRKMLLFNALFKVADASGNTKLTPRVVRCTEFYFMDVFNTAIKTEEQFNPTAGNKLYSFSDLDTGYWMDARFGMAPAVKANPKSLPVMQLLSVHLDWKAEEKPIPESVYPFITDLDLLIPEPASYDDLAKYVDETPAPTAPAKQEEAEPEVVIEEAKVDVKPVEKEPQIEEVVPASEPNASVEEEVSADEDFDLGDLDFN